jgi:DNA mismatch repair protein MutL
LEVEGGIVKGVMDIGAPPGTTERVEDLFFNVPARQKFLKHDQTERQHIDLVVSHYALAHPTVQFRFSQEGKQTLITSGNGNQLEVLISLLGIETAKQMIEVHYEDQEILVTGFISPSSLTRSNRKDFHFYVNRRPVQDNSLATAVIQAYQNYLMVGRFPRVWLFIEIAPENVDVNVHPTKAEVRFANPSWIFSQVQHAVRRALMSRSPIPEIVPQPVWTVSRAWQKVEPRDTTDSLPAESYRNINPSQPSLEEYHRGGRIPLLRLIGQIAATYLIAEGPDGLYLIDQHAAHERVLFEKFLKEAGGKIDTQRLLEPVIVEIPPAQSRLLISQLSLLNSLGFEVEEFGLGTFQVRAIPAILTGMHPAEALKAIIDNFEEDEVPLQNETTKRIIARICKRAAVKGGQILSMEEQRALLMDLEACESPRTCPHGRPTMIHLSVDVLEKQFGRRGV